MASVAFADTSFLVALMLKSDDYHRHAIQLAREFEGKIMCCDEVLVS